MESRRLPRLRAEALVELNTDELRDIAGGHTIDHTCVTCQVTMRNNCATTVPCYIQAGS